MTTYQSKHPVTARIMKKPTSDWEKANGYSEVLIEGARLSFANLWRPGTYSGEAKKSLDTDVIIPLLPENKAAIALIQEAANMAAKACKPSTTLDKIKGKQRKIRAVKLGQPKLDDDGEPMTDDDGNTKLIPNDGHLVISTSNSMKTPPTYITTAGKPVQPKKNDAPASGYDHYEMPVDPNGMTAQELVGTGNNVRVKLSFKSGVDTWNGDKPKVWVSIVAVQFLAEDEKLSKGGDGEAAAAHAAEGFGAVAAPMGDSFDDDNIPSEQPTQDDDDSLFSDEDEDELFG